ncbi:hypothetical protein PRUPE_5G052600 [Prunus persica]|uniref:Topoisomerase 6 subunit A/Spo11 TOPRIM domain-containing protein n=1 Tax=Prunus persica TaxID=3760 RepID=A0A251P3Y7_PRUPE|nr:hypothetical protein PRUPE_5G052600 [Prunus persica]
MGAWADSKARQLNSIINVQEIYARYQLLITWFSESVSDVLLRVLVIVQQLLQENRHGFLGILVDTLRLPTYCLVDCDPYGFDIMSTYRFSSMVRLLDQSVN